MKRAHSLSDEEGSTLPLIIFYGFLSMVLVLLVIAATSLYLERKRLFTLADGAALVGAEAFDLEQVTREDGIVELHLQTADVASAVSDFVEQTPGVDFDSLRIENAESVDGRSATVALSAAWKPPVLTLVLPEGIRIEVTTVARSVFE